jgi:hypothetical protein
VLDDIPPPMNNPEGVEVQGDVIKGSLEPVKV